MIRFKAGYADANSVPKSIKQATLMLVSVWYDERSAISELAYKPVPAAYERIIGKARVTRFR